MSTTDELLRGLLGQVAEGVEVGRTVAERLDRIEAALRKAGEATEGTGEERLWTAEETARYLGAKQSTVYEWAEAGRLPCLRIGGLLRFEPEVVKRWARGGGRPGKVVPIGGRSGT